jgi:hypothetical protein
VKRYSVSFQPVHIFPHLSFSNEHTPKRVKQEQEEEKTETKCEKEWIASTAAVYANIIFPTSSFDQTVHLPSFFQWCGARERWFVAGLFVFEKGRRKSKQMEVARSMRKSNNNSYDVAHFSSCKSQIDELCISQSELENLFSALLAARCLIIFQSHCKKQLL